MSLQEGLIEGDAQYSESGRSTEPLVHREYSGVFGRIRRHFDNWAQLYIEQQVEARTGRDR